MDSKHNGVPEREQRLDEVVAAYLQAVEAGQQPEREDLLRRHPNLLPELAQFFEDADALGGLALRRRSVGFAGGSSDAGLGETIAAGKELGDFRIVREVGKGGMGIVYEAEQLSLRRRVALKVLPFPATMDPRHLQRFHNEARAAACLHHAHIVPVYFVGCERSVHFYAMQFIDGQPLSELIRQMRQREKKTPTTPKEEPTVVYRRPADAAASTPLPAADLTPITGEGRRGRDYFRKVAELGVRAAEALDHAHQLGIVHRDIKPANLLLDGRGNLWITDFGLAQMQHGEASLTLTGQTVGTPRYMSPEQALAKRVPIDHRTDVYSLGATLYELLTLRPAFSSEDRQELLRQIAFEDPSRPRRLERAIPAELETIVLKAMEKRSQDRYSTAQEMADDLRRWLLDQPIRARRPSWFQVGKKWVRRHQSAVWAASLLLVALVSFGLGFSVWWVRQRAAAETDAQVALLEIEHWQRLERWSEASSAINRAKSVLRSFGAGAGLQQRVDELEKDLTMVDRLEYARLQYTAEKDGTFDIKAGVTAYATAFAWYGLDVEHADAGAAAELIRSRSIRTQLVAALDYWAILQRSWKGQQWKQILAVARAADPDEWQNRLRDAWERRDGKAANELLACTEVENLLPTMLQLLLTLDSQNEKISVDRVASLMRRAQQRRAANIWINYDLGWLHYRARPPRLEEAISYFRAAVALRPQSPGMRLNLGLALKDKGLLDEAIAAFREAIRLEKDYLWLHNNLDIAYWARGLSEDPFAEHRRAIRIKNEFAELHSNLGASLWRNGQLDEAIAECRKAIQIKEDIAETRRKFGETLQVSGLPDEALAEEREVIRRENDTAEDHCILGDALQQKGQFGEALNYFRRCHELGSKNPQWKHPSAGWVRNCERMVELDGELATILSGKKQPADNAERLALAQLCVMPCKRSYLEAVRFFREAFEEEPKLTDDLNAQHRYNAACAAALAGCGRGKDADKLDAKEGTRLRQQALDWLRADLKAYRRLMEKSAGKDGSVIAQQMQHWLQDTDLSGVREAESLAHLPEAERKHWHKLWQEVEALRQLAAQPPKATSSARP